MTGEFGSPTCDKLIDGVKCKLSEDAERLGIDLKDMPASRHTWSDIIRCPNDDCGREFMITNHAEALALSKERQRHYTYRAEWSAEDNACVGLVAEFPALSWLAPTASKAVDGVEQLVADIINDMTETGEPIPVPLADRRYSGKIALRTSAEQHRRLSIEAAEQGVSLNQWITQKLSDRRKA